MAFINRKLRHELHLYATRGSKTSRRRQISRIETFVEFCQRPVEQIGKAQVYEFYEKNTFQPSTERDYHYAIRLLWEKLGRTGTVPLPPSMKRQSNHPEQT